jgi:tetratricopeptide (TPR) repeat protein
VTAGDRVGELSALLLAGRYRLSLEPEGAADELEALVEQALPVFEPTGNDLALSLAYRALGEVKNMRAQMDAALAAYERAAAHAQRASLPGEFVTGGAFFRLYGTMPVSELVVWLDEQEAGMPHLDYAAVRARSLARLGRIQDARTVLAQTCAELEERGARLNLAGGLGHSTVELEVLAGDADAAVAAGEHGCRLYEELGERALLSTAAGMLARAFVAAGRLEEADAWAGRAAELGASDDVATQMLWRQARALVLARRGQAEAAQALSREAVAIAEETDFLDAQGDAYSDLADVLVLAGRSEEAAVALEQALTRYERKENLVMASRSRERLQALREQAPA